MPSQPSRDKPKSRSRRPVQKATVIKTASSQANPQNSTVDKKILERIQKCLDRAYHPNASEAEAKAALFVSQKLMSQHNVTQADLIANDSKKSKAHYGGRSVVQITKIGGSSQEFFDCKHYCTDYGTSVEWTFYGIADNTVPAASGFEMAHNKILEWACDYKGGTPTFSYRLGVADGLYSMANREKDRELEDAKRKEIALLRAKEEEDQQQRQKELERLQILPGPSHDSGSPDETRVGDLYPGNSEDKAAANSVRDHDMYDSDADSQSSSDANEAVKCEADFNIDDVNAMDLSGDVDKDIERFIKPEKTDAVDMSQIPDSKPKPSTNIKVESEPQPAAASPWDSGMQLVRFRQTADQVASDYLREKKNQIAFRKVSDFGRSRWRCISSGPEGQLKNRVPLIDSSKDCSRTSTFHRGCHSYGRNDRFICAFIVLYKARNHW
ncbi:hypothetical protein N7468_004237 [Penicillium chermesinum]|uniref:DUF2786 domain-containing protein n=1 Tax=Penicillium chermesinum TaxID=63820 RepID=A0A9W9TT01_9EURO|nr:uncharacterized protein N7468_004237 [Penicillium chermesinum]KAJ5239618.1 hypothetical protein N7468_004237 [Penicillium chermesinum]